MDGIICGNSEPAWQRDCRTLVDIAAKETHLGQVKVINDLPDGLEVFADPLITKVYNNLMDNAVRYGGKITTIRFSVMESDDDQVIVCEDDGYGVVAEDKEKIFERGHGKKNEELGLFRSREILAITGITIIENGTSGKGARFEIRVPNGMYRFTGTKTEYFAGQSVNNNAAGDVLTSSLAALNAYPKKINLKTSGIPIAYGDTVMVNYTDTGSHVKFAGLAVDNAMPVPAPVVTGTTTNAAGTVITIRFNKAMNNPAGKHVEFTYLINGGSVQAFSAAALNVDPTKIDLKTSGTLIAYGDTVTVSYTGTDISATDGGVLEIFAGRSVNNAMPVPVPAVTGAMTNAAGTVITITFSKAMNNPVGKHVEFTYNLGSGSAQLFSTAALNVDPTKIDLKTSGTPIVYGDTVTVSYTGTDITATDGGVLERFRGQSVNNAMPVPAPAVTGATTNSAGTVITITFNKAMNNPVGKHAEFTYQINGGSIQSFSAAALNADPIKVDLKTSGASIVYGDTVTVSYTGTDITATDDGVLERFRGQSVNNAMPVPAPAVTGATTNSAGTVITITFNKAMNNPVGKHAEFTYQINEGSVQSFSAAALNAYPTKIDLTVSGIPIVYGDMVTVSYTGTDITATDGGVLESFGGQSVNNAMPVPAPAVTGATTNAAGTVITITFNKAMNNPVGKHDEFKYRIGSGSAQSFSAAALNVDPTKIDLKTSGTLIANGDTVTVSYIGTDVIARDTGVLVRFKGQSVNNAMPAPAPAVTGAMTNTAGMVITITFNKAMSNPAGKHAGFTYKIGSRSAQSFSAAALNADPTMIDLTTSGTPIAYGDTVTVSYTGADITATDTGVLVRFRARAVNNAVPAPAPAVTGATTNAAGTVITITFNKAMNNPVGKHAGFTYKIGSRSAQSISAATLNADPTKIDLTTSGTPIAYGDTVTISYIGTNITATDTGVLERFRGQSVNNAMPVPAPAVTGATTNAAGTVITITFNKAMNNPAGKHDEFKYRIGSGSAQSISAAALNADPTKIDLTTSGMPIAYGDTIAVSYTGTDITATDTGVLVSFAGRSVDNAMPVPAPVVTGATTNAAGTVITIAFNKAMNNPAGKHAEFTYQINGGPAQSISAAALNAYPIKIDLKTSGTPIAYGDTVTVSYTGTDISATDGGVLESFRGRSVDNAIPVPAPVVTGATTNATGTVITIRFNKAMNNPVGKHAEFTYHINGGSAQSISAAALNADPTKIDLKTSGMPITYGDTITVSYTGTDITATDGGVLESFGGQSDDNTIPAPVITGATTNATGTVITIRFNKVMNNPVGKHAEFNYKIGSGSIQSISAAALNADQTKIDLTTSGTPIAYGDTITVSYTGTNITATDTGVLVSFAGLSVDNAIPVPAPAVTGATTNATGSVITITFNKAMNNPAGKHAEFAYQINGGSVQSFGTAALNAYPTKIDLKTFGTPIACGDTVTVSYTGTDITATDGGVLESFAGLSVDNAMPVPSPAVTGATTNTAGTVITITLNKAMNNPAGKHAEFTYQINGGTAQSISAAALNAYPTKIDLTTSGMPIAYGDTVTVSYTGTDIIATDGGVLESFAGLSVDNAMPVPSPAVTGATTNTAGTIITIRFNKAMNNPAGKHAGFTYKIGSESIQSISAAALNTDSTKIDLTTSGMPIAYGDTVTVSYTGTDITATDGSVLEIFGDQSVDNNVSVDVSTSSLAALNADPTKIDPTTSGTPIANDDTALVSHTDTELTATDSGVLESFGGLSVDNVVPLVPAPTVTGATMNATGTVITFIFNKAMDNPAGKHVEFTYKINGGSVQSFSAAKLNADPTKIDLTTSGTPIANGDTITVSYTGTDITATDGGMLPTFTDLEVTNSQRWFNFSQLWKRLHKNHMD